MKRLSQKDDFRWFYQDENITYAPVVQRIGRKIADLAIEVRFLAGAPIPPHKGGFMLQ